MENFKEFAPKGSDNDIGLTLIFLWQDHICFQGFHMEEFMELVEDLGAKVHKCS